MRYEHVVSRMPEALKQLISSQTWCASYIKEGVSLPDLLTDRKYLLRLLSHLSVDEKNTLRLILCAFGCESFTNAALEKQAGLRMAGAQVAIGLVGLRRAGVIAAFRKAWGEQLFVLPEDAFEAWQGLLFPSVKLKTTVDENALELIPAGSTQTIGSQEEEATVHPRGLAQQLFHFMVACSQQSSLPLTNKGTLHKKQILKLTQHLTLPNDLLRAAGITYAFRDIYDDGAALMLEMAIRMGFISGQGDQLVMCKDAFLTWLDDRYESQQKALYGVWRQLQLPAPVWLQHGLAWMERAETGQWVELDAIVGAIMDCCSEYDQLKEADSLSRALFSCWIAPLSIFRFIELAADKEGGVWFRWLISPREEWESEAGISDDPPNVTEKQSTSSSLYVQPDFEILLLPDVSLRTEWEIAAFADLKQTDHVRTYRMTKEGFYRAWEMGQSSEEIISMLQENAYYDIPEPITITLRQWGEQTGKMHFEEVTLLRCRSSDIADALLRNEKCQPFLRERIGSADFVVPKTQLPQLTKCLESMGYNPKSSRKDESDPGVNTAAKGSYGNQTTGLFYSRDSIQLYEMDAELPERDGLYPDMRDIPSSWLQDFRSYHGSTRKEMIRKAIEWKSCLQLRKEGQNRFIIPRSLREERTGWILEGLEELQEIAWSGEDWEEMKLILPGINDKDI
ncbi:helicase-associated domain-containing protein [Paenibacillus sp. CGMCC 1.16610]|nr:MULTISPECIES: helicase-associated domain-containing protein [Paenibacillus]MBA2937948.1 helicase-associated domain-containing protein [Paenibacillus sp. CGMCC 1.16610]